MDSSSLIAETELELKPSFASSATTAAIAGSVQ